VVRRDHKVRALCLDRTDHLDYKEVGRLRRHLNDRAKIQPRRMTGTCARHQRLLNVALKRARHMALLPFTADVR
jgi:small subunit ribosomal protein S18